MLIKVNAYWTIFSAGIQAGHYLAVDSAHWLDNIHFQEVLTMEMVKICVRVRISGFSTVESIETNWPLFASEDMTWEEFIFGVMAEVVAAQVSFFQLKSINLL